MLRCELPDAPGSLALLAGAIAEVGGDIQAVDVVASEGGRVLDDLIVVIDAGQGAALLAAIGRLEGVRLVHAGPSRGHPGDAAARIAVGLEALLTGQAPPDRALTTLLGGLVQAASAECVPAAEAPEPSGRVCVVPVGADSVVLRRDYRFTDGERDRAAAFARLAALLR